MNTIKSPIQQPSSDFVISTKAHTKIISVGAKHKTKTWLLSVQFSEEGTRLRHDQLKSQSSIVWNIAGKCHLAI